MIYSTKEKLAASAVKGKYGKGFPGELVKRARAMLTAQPLGRTER
jgi:proteic killer suppression protein